MQLYTKILIGMLVGAVFGAFLGPNSPVLPLDGVRAPAASLVLESADPDAAPIPASSGESVFRLTGETEVGDETWLELTWTVEPNDLLRLGDAAGDVRSGDEITGWMVDDGMTVHRFSRTGQALVNSTSWVGDIFLRMIKMVVVPLVFLSLLVGVASLGDPRKLGRIGVRTVGFFFLTTSFALVIGMTLANVAKPGNVLNEDDRARMLASYQDAAGDRVASAAEAPTLVDQLVSIVPTNPIASLAGGEMLQVIFFALMLGFALTLMDEDKSKPVVEMADRLNDAVIMIVLLAMEIAPFGVAALLFETVGSTGLSVLIALLYYAGVVVVGLLLHVILVYSTVLRVGAKVPIKDFVMAMRPALLLAFSTSSSSATLPVSKQCAEDYLNVSPPVTSFVLPLGATINMDGTALYQGVAALFIAQIYNMDLSMADQATVVLTATLASVGAAGVPGAGMVTLAMVLASVGVPTTGVALILGVDRLLDMFRTTTNVFGDATATLLMARLEGDPIEYRSADVDRADPKHGFEGRDMKPHAVPVDHTGLGDTPPPKATPPAPLDDTPPNDEKPS